MNVGSDRRHSFGPCVKDQHFGAANLSSSLCALHAGLGSRLELRRGGCGLVELLVQLIIQLLRKSRHLRPKCHGGQPLSSRRPCAGVSAPPSDRQRQRHAQTPWRRGTKWTPKEHKILRVLNRSPLGRTAITKATNKTMPMFHLRRST